MESPDRIEVYDLIWTDRSFNDYLRYKKWRFYVSFDTSLPQKVEFYQKSAFGNEYDLKYTKAVNYLDNNEIRKVIKEASF
jgi:hypothetical protein